VEGGDLTERERVWLVLHEQIRGLPADREGHHTGAPIRLDWWELLWASSHD
jgi:hypothetical protein